MERTASTRRRLPQRRFIGGYTTFVGGTLVPSGFWRWQCRYRSSSNIVGDDHISASVLTFLLGRVVIARLTFRRRALCYLSKLPGISMRMGEQKVLHIDQEETDISLSVSITSFISGRSCIFSVQHLLINPHKGFVSLG